MIGFVITMACLVMVVVRVLEVGVGCAKRTLSLLTNQSLPKQNGSPRSPLGAIRHEQAIICSPSAIVIGQVLHLVAIIYLYNYAFL
jgi:hypothetical protein